MPLEEKLGYADYVVNTDGMKPETSVRVAAIYAELKELAKRT
jgi:hypothetical protein